ncbi:hypothetical protein ABPG74_020906 [Tetrahymena malaccensis]
MHKRSYRANCRIHHINSQPQSKQDEMIILNLIKCQKSIIVIHNKQNMLTTIKKIERVKTKRQLLDIRLCSINFRGVTHLLVKREQSQCQMQISSSKPNLDNTNKSTQQGQIISLITLQPFTMSPTETRIFILNQKKCKNEHHNCTQKSKMLTHEDSKRSRSRQFRENIKINQIS